MGLLDGRDTPLLDRLQSARGELLENIDPAEAISDAIGAAVKVSIRTAIKERIEGLGAGDRIKDIVKNIRGE